MADGSGNETLRQMLSGFNMMQASLGLLPPQTGSPSIGLGAGVAAPPPPPVIPHPAEAAMAAMQRHTAATQHTLAAAQMTRMMPPPSAPTPSSMGGSSFGWGDAMGQMSSQQLSPFAAAGLSGNGYGMPSPSMMTPPAFGMFRPGGGGMPQHMLGSARMPSIFNPMAPTMPSPHFMTPEMHSMQMMRMRTAQGIGAMGGVGETMMHVANPFLGGLVGRSAFGLPIQDMAQGRMIQNMTTPFMVSGSSLDSSGQGLSADAGRQVATGLRHMGRDPGFERTGFNTADATRIMSLSGQHGLLTGAQNPDDILRRVKEISKSVKVLMQITGDPDVRDAIESLGKMRDLGFQGLAAQSGAVANRAAFARMAGVSQGAMHDTYGMPGAMMAQQVGLSGATGYQAGMAGGALANIAASSGALNDLQLSRAGGRSGLAQINTMAQISAMQSDLYLQAALKKGAGGHLEVDMDAYRKAQTMTVSEVAREAAARTQQMGTEGIFEWRTRRQEFKDQIAQKLSPFEMNMNVVRQAQGLQRQVPGMNLGSAIFSTVQSTAVGAGMSESDAEQTARALELQFTSQSYWQGQKQQLAAQRRMETDQERARFGQFARPGIATGVRRDLQDRMSRLSDLAGRPFQVLSDVRRMSAEEEEAAGYGEHIRRIDESNIAHDSAERQLMMGALRSSGFQSAYASGRMGDPLGRGHANRMANRISSGLGFDSTSGANRAASLASESWGTTFGLHPLGSFGNADDAMERLNDVVGAGRGMRMADTYGDPQRKALLAKLSASGITEADLTAARSSLGPAMSGMASRGAGAATAIGGVVGLAVDNRSASALGRSDFRQAFVSKAADKAAAGRAFDANADAIIADMTETYMAFGTQEQKEVIGKTRDIATKAGAVDVVGSREGIKRKIGEDFKKAGLDLGMSDETATKLGGLVAHHSDDTIAMSAALQASISDDPDERARGASQLDDLRKKLGPQKYEAAMREAHTIGKGLDASMHYVLQDLAKGDPAKLGERVAAVREASGLKKAAPAMDALMERLGLKVGGEDDPLEAIKKLSDSDLDAMDDQGMAKLLRKAQGGDRDALAQAAARAAPTSKETRYGGSSALDKRMAEVDDMIAQAAPDEGGAMDPAAKAKLEASTTSLFADSVKTFADAVKDMKGGHDEVKAVVNSPWLQAFWKGG